MFFQLWLFLGFGFGCSCVFVGGNVTYINDGGCHFWSIFNQPTKPQGSDTHDTHLRNPTRPLLLPSKKDNGLVPKRPKSRQVSSKYMSLSPSTSASMPKRYSSPLINRSTNSIASSTPLPVVVAMSTITSDPLLLLPLIGGKIGRHFVGFITGRRSQLSPAGNLPLSHFPFPLSLSWWSRKGMKEREWGKGKERGIADWREVWVATGDDANKVSAGFTGKGERGGWWVREKKREDNFGKSLDLGVISALNM